MSTTAALFLTALVLIAAAVAALLIARSSRQRRNVLQRRFGPEYDRALEDYGNADRAHRELAARAKRVRAYQIHELEEQDRQRFTEAWRTVQARFVDDPSGAVAEADSLIAAVMQARGYPMEDFEQRLEDLTVEHPNVVQHYRAADSLAQANRAGSANTEDLRQALVHYRALFADLLEPSSVMAHRPMQEARV
jgi:hypothetical protein